MHAAETTHLVSIHFRVIVGKRTKGCFLALRKRSAQPFILQIRKVKRSDMAKVCHAVANSEGLWHWFCPKTTEFIITPRKKILEKVHLRQRSGSSCDKMCTSRRAKKYKSKGV